MASGGRTDLLSNASATGNAAQWPGGKGIFIGEGTFSGSTLTLQVVSPNGTSINVAGVSLTANGTADFNLPPGQIKGALTGGTPSAMFAWAVQVPQK